VITKNERLKEKTMKSSHKKILIGFGLLWLIVTLIAGYYIQRSARLFFALKDEMKRANTVKPSKAFEKLAMQEKYDISSLKDIAFESNNSENKTEFMEKTEAFESNIDELSTKMLSQNYHDDWTTGVNYIDTDTTNNKFDLTAPRVNYQKLRKLSNTISVMSLFYAYKKNDKKAARLLMVNASLIRQFISHCNENNGVALIDAMISLALVGNIRKVVEKSKGFNGYDSSLFPLLSDRLEKLDELYPLIGKALRHERSLLPSFFERFNKRASKEMGANTVVIDKKWMNDQLDLYYAPLEVFNTPYLKSRDTLKEYTKRIEKSGEVLSGSSLIWTGLFSPFKAVFQILSAIAIPNYIRAYEKECIRRSELRGSYLAFAIPYYKTKYGEYPAALSDLKKVVKPEMLVEPYTGEQFTYKRRFDKVTLTSKIKDETITYLDI